MPNNSLTLSQLQQLISNVINLEPGLRNVWVQAEFSDLRVAGGHCYMELIEKDSAGTTRAKIRAMIWRGTLDVINRKFFEATGRYLASGLKVLVRGSASHHPVYGLSFTISDIDPAYTLGDMERVRREILERLARENIIGCNKSLALSPTPQRIAVISAAGTAGYGDFMNQIANNPDRFAVYTLLFPAIMQGERTAASVIDALDKVEMTAPMWDAVVIIRGGGATTDLNGFDNYDLARRVALCPIPVIVGIGHERDRTVLDEIACVRCKTPTAVAAFIIDALRVAYTGVTEIVRRITKYGADALRGEHLRLSNMSQTLPALARNRILREHMNLNRLSQILPGLVQQRVMQQKIILDRFASRLDRAVDARINAGKLMLERYAMRLAGASANVSQRENMRLRRLSDMIRLLSPDNTLRRGYSITRVNGHAITDPASIEPGALIETTLAAGTLTSTKT